MRALRRPTDIHDVLDRLEDFRSEAADAAVAAFVARPDDVFICTYSKSGTTWVQHVVHQLRSGGSMDFTEISAVVPWLESAADVGMDPSAEQPWSPRAFKCHLMWRDVPRGGRHITVFRDPVTVLPSFYRFFEGWWFEPGSITLEEFANELYMGGSASGRHWDHLVDWWPRVHDPDVLALTYEDMIAAPDRVPAVIADFLGIEMTADEMSTIVRHCSRTFMADHHLQFSEQLIRHHRDPVWGLPPGGTADKVTRGSDVVLSPDLLVQLDNVWQEAVASKLGFANYQQFRRALPDPLDVRT